MDQFKHYSQRILDSMAVVEDLAIGQTMFHELHPEIERAFWKAHDAKDVRKLRVINEQLNKLIDHKRSISGVS